VIAGRNCRRRQRPAAGKDRRNSQRAPNFAGRSTVQVWYSLCPEVTVSLEIRREPGRVCDGLQTCLVLANQNRGSGSTSGRAPQGRRTAPGRQGLPRRRVRDRARASDSIVDGAIIDGAAVATRSDVCSRTRRSKPTDVAASLCRQRGHREEISLPVMTDSELARIDLLGGGGSTSRSTSRRQPRLPDSRPRHRSRVQGTMEVLLVAARRKDRRLHRSHRRGRPRPVIVDVDALPCRRLRGELRARGRAIIVLLNAGAAHQHQHRERGASRSSRATSRSAATPTPKRCRRIESAVRERRAREEGHRRRRDLEDVTPGAACDDGETCCSNSETFDFFKATAALRPHRSHR